VELGKNILTLRQTNLPQKSLAGSLKETVTESSILMTFDVFEE
jgi:hypothetical protein